MDYRALTIAMSAQMIQRLEPNAIAEMPGRSYLEWYHELRLTHKDFMCAMFMQYDFNPVEVCAALEALWHTNQDEVYGAEEQDFHDDEIFDTDAPNAGAESTITYLVVEGDEMPQV